MIHSVGKEQLPACPAIHYSCAVSVFRHQHITVSGSLDTENVHLGIDQFPVNQYQHVHVDIHAIDTCPDRIVILSLDSEKTSVACLHVGIYENIVPVLLLHNGIPEEEPYAVLCRITAVIADRADLMRLFEDAFIFVNSYGLSRPLNDFYDLAAEAEKAHTARGKIGKPSPAVVDVRKTKTLIANTRKEIYKIMDDKNLTPERKRELIDVRQEKINRIAKGALKKYKDKF